MNVTRDDDGLILMTHLSQDDSAFMTNAFYMYNPLTRSTAKKLTINNFEIERRK